MIESIEHPSANDVQDSGHKATNGYNSVTKATTNGHSEPANEAGMSIHINNLEVRGFISSNCQIANFLNIPFARIPARFRQAKLVDPRKEKGVIDATKYGPRCPQPLDVLHDLTNYLYERMSTRAPQSEFQCLNLNIYSPPDAIASGAKLPVLVWIHGGAYTYGDGSCEFDGNFLVRRSISLGKPIVVVSINYRLGYFGFLSSKELRDEADELGEVGYANQGLYDQRLGLQWIQNNIHFFGGDGFQLTAAGESAGAFSVLAHLRSNFPAFQQAFIMSCPTGSLHRPDNHQEIFDRLVASTGVAASAPAADKIAALRSLTAKEIEGLLDGNATPAYDDKFWVDQDPTLALEDGPFPSWAKTVVVGMTKDENALFSQLWQSMSASELITSIRNAFHDPTYAQEILDTYSISESSPQADVVESCIQYTTDCLFSHATYAIASKHDSHPVCLYSFDQVDVTDSLFTGKAYHSQDIAFLFHLPAVGGTQAPAPWRATADAYSKACVELVNGEVPWEPYRAARRGMSFNGEKTDSTTDFNFKRWIHLTSTKERADMFAEGKMLLYQAMKYGMSLDTPLDS